MPVSEQIIPAMGHDSAMALETGVEWHGVTKFTNSRGKPMSERRPPRQTREEIARIRREAPPVSGDSTARKLEAVAEVVPARADARIIDLPAEIERRERAARVAKRKKAFPRLLVMGFLGMGAVGAALGLAGPRVVERIQQLSGNEPAESGGDEDLPPVVDEAADSPPEEDVPGEPEMTFQPPVEIPTVEPIPTEQPVDYEAVSAELAGYSREELSVSPDVWQRFDAGTATQADVGAIETALNQSVGMFVAEDSPLRGEAEEIKVSLVDHEVGGVQVGVEQAQAPEGEAVDLVVVRERGTDNIVVHVDGWGPHPDKWVTAEAVEGTRQVPVVISDQWAEIPETLRLLPQTETPWYVGYEGKSGTIDEYYFVWRQQRQVVSKWSLKGLYAGTRLEMPNKFEQLVWVEPPEVDTSDDAVDAWIETMLTKKPDGSFAHFTSSAGYTLDENYLRRALELVKTMGPKQRAFVLAYEGGVDFWEQRRDSQVNERLIHLTYRYLNYGFGQETLGYLMQGIIHEATHIAQEEIHPGCSPSDNAEHQPHYLQYGWYRGEFGDDSFIRGLIEDASYDTCAG